MKQKLMFRSKKLHNRETSLNQFQLVWAQQTELFFLSISVQNSNFILGHPERTSMISD